MAPPTDLSLNITNDRWKEVILICQSQPQKAKIWGQRQGFFEGLKDSNVLPIHEVLIANGPLEVVQTLLHAYPESIGETESSYQRLPIHCACRKNANPRVIEFLLKLYANGALIADSLGRLPLHYALSNGANDEVVDLLIKKHKNSARGVDNRGWTPLHVACGMGASTYVVTSLVNCYPEACILKTKKGSRPIKCLNPSAGNKDEVKRILIAKRREIEKKMRPAQLVKQGSERTLV